MPTQTSNLTLVPDNAQRLASLCGRLNEHIGQIEDSLSLKIKQRGNVFQLSGSESAVARASALLENLYRETVQGAQLSPDQVHLALQEARSPSSVAATDDEGFVLKTPKSSVKPRNPHQREYVKSIMRHDINFGIGPAGTGKTYLAVAAAVDALERQEIRRILLTRPAVEAGEKLGFLPGDLSQKVDPYLRPLYDALFEMLGFEKVEKLIERNVIEVAPLAYMRGRTLNDAFIILDESQNTTVEQMKMFLTRIGFNSKAVITGDITQVDLPRGTRSGLRHAIEVLKDVNDISFNFFNANDVVRHPVVARIVMAYEDYETQQERIRIQKKAEHTQQQSDNL